MSDISSIEANLAGVQQQIARACEKVGRSAGDVTLIAVTKTVGNDEVAELIRLGVKDFGENRVQPGCAKTAHFAEKQLNWHFIGHLQRNKAGDALEGFSIVHSVESTKLLHVLQKEAAKRDKTVDTYLEVNISAEESKYGLTPDDVLPLLLQTKDCPNIRPVGLMCMAPFFDNPEDTRPVFRNLRLLRDKLQDETSIALPQLSMGMSNDYDVAVEEGATHVRVGSALFA